MISVRPSRGSARSAAILVRLVAFVVATASVFVIPSTIAAAAAGHVTTQAAFATAGAASGLTLLAILAARSLDPLRLR